MLIEYHCSIKSVAIAGISLIDPPTLDIFRAVLVMNVRRPLWLEHPWSPSISYHRENMFTIDWEAEYSCSNLRGRPLFGFPMEIRSPLII